MRSTRTQERCWCVLSSCIWFPSKRRKLSSCIARRGTAAGNLGLSWRASRVDLKALSALLRLGNKIGSPLAEEDREGEEKTMRTTNDLDVPEHLCLCFNCERVFADRESRPQLCDKCGSTDTIELPSVNEWRRRLRESPLRRRAKPEDRAGPASAS